MAKIKTQTQPPKHHYVRTFFASLFGFIALSLIIVSILVVWLDQTLTNTDQYVKTIAPLVSKPEVQDFVVDKASSALLDNKDVSIRDISEKLLGADQMVGKTDDQLRAESTVAIKDSLRTVLTSPKFVTLWDSTNREVHSQLITELRGNSGTVNLNFHPLIVGVIDELGTTKLGFVKDKIELKDDVGVIVLKGDQLDNARKIYSTFKKAVIAIVALAVLASILCVLISVHHLKTMRRIAIATGLFSAFYASLLSATSLFKIEKMDEVQRKMAVAVVDSVTHDLRLLLIVIAVVGIGGSIASKVYAVVAAKKS